MKASKSVYVCSECDYQSSKWLGKCPSCGAWNTFVEETYQAPARTGLSKSSASGTKLARDHEPAQKFADFTMPDYLRHSTGIGELDRVLGGGMVEGSVILLAGEPGNRQVDTAHAAVRTDRQLVQGAVRLGRRVKGAAENARGQARS